jgi:hypothetical protein
MKTKTVANHGVKPSRDLRPSSPAKLFLKPNEKVPGSPLSETVS